MTTWAPSCHLWNYDIWGDVGSCILMLQSPMNDFRQTNCTDTLGTPNHFHNAMHCICNGRIHSQIHVFVVGCEYPQHVASADQTAPCDESSTQDSIVILRNVISLFFWDLTIGLSKIVNWDQFDYLFLKFSLKIVKYDSSGIAPGAQIVKLIVIVTIFLLGWIWPNNIRASSCLYYPLVTHT
jgi:hypothetical protein